MTLALRVPADLVAVAIAKEADPTKRRAFDRIVDGLASDIEKAAKAGEVRMFRQASKELERRWSTLTKAQQNRVLARVGPIIERHYVSMNAKAAVLLEQYGRQVARGTRRVFKRSIDPNISASLTSKDREFIGRVSRSRSWFIKNHGVVISENYREKAAEIVADGAAKGLSDKQVSKELAARFKNTAIDQSEAYYRIVANAAMNRSRTWASLNSYREAGIRGYRYQSVLDERTSTTCRFLHGREYIVSEGIDLMDRTEQEALTNPEAVKDMTPWMTEIKDKKTGDKFLAFKRGERHVRVAKIERSAVGRRDAIGDYKQLRTDEQLKSDGFQFPPSHGLCRSHAEPIV